jgi:hypothetical protein
MGALACGLAAMLLAGTPTQGKHLDTVVQDDALLLARPPAQVRQTARTIAELGADRVRLTASWSTIAPAPDARERPGRPFDPRSPSTYPPGAWDRLDTAVRAARDAGLRVMIDIGFWAPRWAVSRPSTNPARERYKPDPYEFANFAEAVVRRYGGLVDMFTPWNEPNHPSFLAPQWVDGKPQSPQVYRAMYTAAYDAIKRVQPEAKVLLGGTASTGGGGVPPLRFLRELACVDERLEPLRTAACRRYKPLLADGYAHHPYSRTTDPEASDPDPDDAPIGDTARLTALLRELSARGRIAGAPLPLYDTEYGYESKPDDPYAPFGRDQAAQFLSRASFLAWKDPDTRMFAQFLLRDIDPANSRRAVGTRAYYRDFQTGLLDAGGRLKPAATAFKLPFWAEVHSAQDANVIVAWGMVRPARGRVVVRLEQQGADGAWRPVEAQTPGACGDGGMEFLTDSSGTFVGTLPAAGPLTLRMAWRHGDGSWEPSLPVATG